MAVVHKTATWERHHTHALPERRRPDPGQRTRRRTSTTPASGSAWPATTALSLEHWTIGLALVSMFVVTALTVKRRYFGRRPAPAYGAVESVGAPSITMPEISDT